MERLNPPVWHQSVVWTPEHHPDVEGMVLGGVKISVIACKEKKVDDLEKSLEIILFLPPLLVATVLTVVVSSS